MEKRYQVFLSSTYEDLREERAAAILSLLKLKCIPAGMELFLSSDNSVWEVVQQTIEESDYYILIVAGRYGSISNDGVTSWTEREYDYAQEIHKPTFVFLYKELANMLHKHVENEEKIKAFRNKASKSRLVAKCSSLGDLQSEITAAIANAKENNPGIGWIRADCVSEAPGDKREKGNNKKIEEIRNIYNKRIEIKYNVHYWESSYVITYDCIYNPPYDMPNSLTTTKELLFGQLASHICSKAIDQNICINFLNDYLQKTQNNFIKINQRSEYNKVNFIADDKTLFDIINTFHLDNLTMTKDLSKFILTDLGKEYYKQLLQ